jgi:hypothetical protein
VTQLLSSVNGDDNTDFSRIVVRIKLDNTYKLLSTGACSDSEVLNSYVII